MKAWQVARAHGSRGLSVWTRGTHRVDAAGQGFGGQVAAVCVQELGAPARGGGSVVPLRRGPPHARRGQRFLHATLRTLRPVLYGLLAQAAQRIGHQAAGVQAQRAQQAQRRVVLAPQHAQHEVVRGHKGHAHAL